MFRRPPPCEVEVDRAAVVAAADQYPVLACRLCHHHPESSGLEILMAGVQGTEFPVVMDRLLVLLRQLQDLAMATAVAADVEAGWETAPQWD